MTARSASLLRVVLIVSFLGLSPAFAAAPTDQVRATVDRVLAILENPQLKPAERRAQLKEAISARFDFTEMAKRSLGPEWRRRIPQEQSEFVTLFTELLEAVYLSRIENYSEEKVSYLRETQEQNFAAVGTKIVTKQGEEVSVVYRLHQVGEEWKVYDVVIENVSVVNNYRSQFTRVLSSSGFEELLRRLRERVAQGGALQ
jgi:phospholipid transport system substrate-binding protein